MRRRMFHVKHWASLCEPVVEQLEIAAKYAGYIERQKDEVERAAHYENLKLPAELDYMQVTALSIEVRQKLNKHRPETLGLASRISGVTPAAISLLLVHLKKSRFKGFADAADRGEAGGMSLELDLPRRGAGRARPGARATARSPGSCSYLDLLAEMEQGLQPDRRARPGRDADPAPARQPGRGRPAAARRPDRPAGALAGRRVGRRPARRGDRHLLPGDPGRLRGHGRQEGGLHPAGGGAAAAAQPARRARPGRAAGRTPTTWSAPAPSPRWPTSSRWSARGAGGRRRLDGHEGQAPGRRRSRPCRRTWQCFTWNNWRCRGWTPSAASSGCGRVAAGTLTYTRRSTVRHLPGASMFGVADYGAFVAAIIIFLAIPGPGNLALITSTGKGGIRGGLAATFGVIAGDQVLMWAAVAGVAALLAGLPGRLPRRPVAGRGLPGLAGRQDAAGQAGRQADPEHRAAPLLPARLR